VVSRVVDVEEADKWAAKVEELEETVDAVMREEKEEKVLMQAETEVRKGENIIKHEVEIMGRPKRTWFETQKEKDAARQKGRRELNGVDSVLAGKEKKKLSGKDKKKLDLRRERVEGKVWKKGKGDRGDVGEGKSKGASKVKSKSKSKSKPKVAGRRRK
jgi:ATP-dependent RNA helicase DDX27